MLSALGMLLGICVKLLDQQIVTFNGILLGMGLGTLVGIAGARMIAMTIASAYSRSSDFGRKISCFASVLSIKIPR